MFLPVIAIMYVRFFTAQDLRTEYGKDLILPTDKPTVPSLPGVAPPTKAMNANGGASRSVGMFWVLDG